MLFLRVPPEDTVGVIGSGHTHTYTHTVCVCVFPVRSHRILDNIVRYTHTHNHIHTYITHTHTSTHQGMHKQTHTDTAHKLYTHIQATDHTYTIHFEKYTLQYTPTNEPPPPSRPLTISNEGHDLSVSCESVFIGNSCPNLCSVRTSSDRTLTQG